MTEPTGVSYTADFSNGLPEDWSLFEGSETELTTSKKTDGGLSLTHADGAYVGGAEAKYHGGLYEIATSLGNLTDFELSMTYKALDYANASRFVGIMYHTQKSADGGITGYAMTYRARGKSEQVTVTEGPVFHYGAVSNTKVAMTDGAAHTLKITMVNGHASHFVDGTLITEYDISDYGKLLGGNQNEGGFGLIVNKSEIEISALTITGAQGNEVAVKHAYDRTETNIYIPSKAPINAPSVITEIKSDKDFIELKKSVRAQTAIVYVDSDMNVLDENGEVLGAFDGVYTQYFKGRVLPAVYVTTEEEANGFINYFATQRDITDITVISQSTELVKLVRDAQPKIRGVVDWSKTDITDSLSQVCVQSNIAKANAVILTEEQATFDTVEYIQARFKAVWVRSGAATNAEVASVVTTGVFGIVTPNPVKVYNVYRRYAEFDLPMSRAIFSVGHRGAPFDYAENSLKGCIAAYEAGASHVEIDVKMTSDNQMVIMHDDTLNRTTNYTGTKQVHEMTLAEIQEYQIIKTQNGNTVEGEPIPTLDDIFEYFKGKDMIIFVEIKCTSNQNIVPKLKESLDKYDIYDQANVIVGNTDNIIQRLHEGIPEVPVLRLMSTPISATNTLMNVTEMLAELSVGFNSPASAVGTPYLTENLKARGYLTAYWTYNEQTDINRAMKDGTLFVTNNSPESIAHYAKRLLIKEPLSIGAGADLSTQEFDAVFLTYKGEEVATTAKVAIQSVGDGYVDVVLYSEFTDATTSFTYTLFAEKQRITVA